MHHLLIIGAAALAIALWPGPGDAEASLGGLTGPGIPGGQCSLCPAIPDILRSYYRSRCEGGGWAEIRELQRFFALRQVQFYLEIQVHARHQPNDTIKVLAHRFPN